MCVCVGGGGWVCLCVLVCVYVRVCVCSCIHDACRSLSSGHHSGKHSGKASSTHNNHTVIAVIAHHDVIGLDVGSSVVSSEAVMG